MEEKMEQKEAGEIVNNYINRIYSFVKKRVSNEDDVQDISQEIAFKLYKSLCIKDVINVDGFVWTVARNTLVNFYRDNGRFKMNVSIDDNEVKISDGSKDMIDNMIEKELLICLRFSDKFSLCIITKKKSKKK